MEAQRDAGAQGDGAQVAGVGVELAVGDFDDAPVEVGKQRLIDASDGTPVELSGAGGVVAVGEVAGAEEELRVWREIDDMRMQGKTGTDQGAKERGVAGGPGELESDVAAHLAERHLKEIGIEAKAPAVTPLVRGGQVVARGAELAVEGCLCLGCRDGECEEEQDEKSAVNAGTTD